MKNLTFFKNQSKYLLKDWETRKVNPGTDEEWEGQPYVYDCLYFDMLNMVNYFQIGDDFSLQKAQHIIAQMAGFKKWDDLQKADEDELALARIRFLHIDPNQEESWNRHCRFIKWDQLSIEAKFVVIKDYMYNSKSNYLMIKQFKDEVLYGKEREVALQKELDIFPNRSDPELMVECMHCGQKYLNKEVKVIHEYEFGLSGEHDAIVCKNYPKCDGTLIDLMDSNEVSKWR